MAYSDFLKRKKQEAAMKNNMSRSVAPSMRSRYNINDMGGYNVSSGKYTGAGPNGIVEPFLPTERRIDAHGRPYIVDEGELLVNNAETVNDYGGPQQLDQFIQKNRPGQQIDSYRCGGTPTRRYMGGGIPTASVRQHRMLQEASPRYQEGGVPTAPMTQQQKPMGSPIKHQDMMKGPIIPPNIQNKVPGPKTGIPGPVGKNLGITKPPNTGGITVGKITPNIPTPIPVNPIKPDVPVKPDPITPIKPDPIPVTPVTPVDPVTPPDPTPVDPYVLPKVGGDPIPQDELRDAIMNKYLSRYGAMNEAERAAAAQRGLQMGLSGREIAGQEAIGDISRRSAMGDVVSDVALDAMQSAEQKQMSQEALEFQKEQFEFQKQKYQKEFEWMQKQYGDQDFQRLWADIANGMTLEQAMAKYPHLKIDQNAFNSIQATTPMATQNYQKKMDAVNMLLQQGGAANLQQAQTMLKGMLGADIDFTNALKAENIQNFNNGMSQMSKYIASGMDWKQAMKAMEKDGTLDQLGLLEGDVEKMYQQMQLNSSPIYQTSKMVDQLVSSGQITKEEGEQMMDLYKWSIINPQGFKVQDSYQVVDKNGVEVANFKTEVEAQKFLEENPNLQYQVKQLKNGWITVGDQTGQTGQTGETGQTEKDIFTKWQESQVPEDVLEEGWLTQDEWVKAGKPKTWDEFKKTLPETFDIFQKYEKSGSVINENGVITHTDDEVNKLIELIKDGDAYTKSKYGIEEGGEIDNFIKQINANPFNFAKNEKVKGIMGSTAEKGETQPISKEEVKKNAGKIITMKDNFGKEQDFIITGEYDEEIITHPNHTTVLQKIEVIDPETGKKRYLTLRNR